MSERDRIRWHCRRGLLELDLVLARFVDEHLEKLDPTGIAAFKDLLNYPDNDLLDLVMGRAELVDEGVCAPVLALLRQTKAQPAL
ncbi:MAG: succinate dehydrogenase assembly factor 2 [Rhodospirillaceae bacterium]